MLLLFAGLAITVSLTAYARLDRDRAAMQAQAERFAAAGRFVTDYHRAHDTYPVDRQLQDWAAGQGYDRSWTDTLGGTPPGGSSVACTDAQPEPGFTRPASDTFLLHRWHSEWFDCYSLPSGSNNIVYALDGASPLFHAICWGLGVACLIAAWLIRPRPDRRIRA